MKKLVRDAQNAHHSHQDYDKIILRATEVFLKHCQEEENDQLKKLQEVLPAEESDVCPYMRYLKWTDGR